MEKEAFTYMANSPEEIARSFEEQSKVQKMHQEMLQVQQELINYLKKMTTLLPEKPKKCRIYKHDNTNTRGGE